MVGTALKEVMLYADAECRVELNPAQSTVEKDIDALEHVSENVFALFDRL